MELKLGKLAPKIDPRTLKMATYMPHLPPPLPAIDHSNGHTKDWGMMLNNEIGDCAIAGIAHAVQTWTLQTSTKVTESDDVVLSYYKKWAGYDGTWQTDRGAIMLDMLNLWRKETFNGHELLGYVTPDRSNFTNCKHAIQLFGGLYAGLALPNSVQGQDVWKVKSPDGGLWGGHAVHIVGYDPDWLWCISWGKIIKMTWDFWLKYSDEAYCLLGKDWLGHFYLGGTNYPLMEPLVNAFRSITQQY